MKVFKFGGASVKNADGVRNLLKVLSEEGSEQIFIVVSAMGKTTNALEIVVQKYLEKDSSFLQDIEDIKCFHQDIVQKTFKNPNHSIYKGLDRWFEDLKTTLNRNKSTQYDFVYDQIVSYGELISTFIVSEFLNLMNVANIWLDARNFIKTNDQYRDATVNWDETQKTITNHLNPNQIYVTQGFIGSDFNNFTTTLGREGSDYSAAIFAYCINAQSLTIWKDVPGVLNADPKKFENPILLSQISYEEAIELAFYGASVIHPKTLQPLQKKEIPLLVKSFLYPEKRGTIVTKGKALDPYSPCFIVKENQVLLSLSSLDFSFVVEENISEIFKLFHQYHLKVDLIQNSAISFSVCLDNKFGGFKELLMKLKSKFKVSYNTGVSLYTIRHYTPEAIAFIEQNKEILLKQTTRETYQMITKQ